MLIIKELREGFELRDLRRKCETMLAALGVSSDIRAQVQTHGLGGVRARHYYRYHHMAGKSETLKIGPSTFMYSITTAINIFIRFFCAYQKYIKTRTE
jgi:hypothetical protein